MQTRTARRWISNCSGVVMMVASAGCATTDDGGTSGSVAETGDSTSASMETEAGDAGDETGGDTDGGTSEVPGDDVTITAFSEEHIYFGAENRRQVDGGELPPAEQLFESVRLNFSLGCPNDNWTTGIDTGRSVSSRPPVPRMSGSWSFSASSHPSGSGVRGPWT